MPRSPRRRRRLNEVEDLALKLAEKGPFTAQDYAEQADFTPNRARQLLESLKEAGKIAELGRRPSARGKPAVLWGKQGTKLTEADLKAPPPRPKAKAPAAARSGMPVIVQAKAQAGFLERLILAAFSKGVKVKDAEGKTWLFQAKRA